MSLNKIEENFVSVVPSSAFLCELGSNLSSSEEISFCNSDFGLLLFLTIYYSLLLLPAAILY